MEGISHPEQLPDYRPIGRITGRPLKRLLVGCSSETQTGHLLTLLRDQKKKKKKKKKKTWTTIKETT
jgi:hypothetical protein